MSCTLSGWQRLHRPTECSRGDSSARERRSLSSAACARTHMSCIPYFSQCRMRGAECIRMLTKIMRACVCRGGEKNTGDCWWWRRPFAEFRELGVWSQQHLESSRNRISVIVSCRLHSARNFCFFCPESLPPQARCTHLFKFNNPRNGLIRI